MSEERYIVAVELTDGGKRVVWDDLGCYATGPEQAAKNTLKTFSPKSKAVVKTVRCAEGKIMIWNGSEK